MHITVKYDDIIVRAGSMHIMYTTMHIVFTSGSQAQGATQETKLGNAALSVIGTLITSLKLEE